MDLVHEDDSDDRHQSQRDSESDDAFGQGELGFGQIAFAVNVFLLIRCKDIVENRVVAFGIVPDKSMLDSQALDNKCLKPVDK